MLFKIFVFVTLATSIVALNFPITKSRQTCLLITEGSYQFEYVVSGHSEKEILCVIQEQNRTIFQIVGKSEFQAEFNVTKAQASICFSSLDNHAKSVSVDFMRTDDPLRGVIADKQKMAIHEQLFKSYQQLQKVYRDQHFFIERNFIHSILLKQTEIVVIFFLLLKIFVAFFCSCFQMYYVKRILEDNFKPLASEEPNESK